MSEKRWYLSAPTPGEMLGPPHGIYQVSAQKAQIWTTAKLLLTQRNIVFPLIPTSLKLHELFLKMFYSKCVQKLEYSYVNKIQVNIHSQRILAPVFALFLMFPKLAATLRREALPWPPCSECWYSSLTKCSEFETAGGAWEILSVAPAYNLISQTGLSQKTINKKLQITQRKVPKHSQTSDNFDS